MKKNVKDHLVEHSISFKIYYYYFIYIIFLSNHKKKIDNGKAEDLHVTILFTILEVSTNQFCEVKKNFEFFWHTLIYICIYYIFMFILFVSVA